jgi:hypothetical protein
VTCRSREEDFGTTTMTGWWFGSGMRGSAPLPWTTWMDRLEGIHRHIASAYLWRYAQERSWRGTTAVCRTVSKSTASQLCLLVTIGSGTRKMFMPKQKLHSHEEVFKDHVSGQYDETIFRFRVPGGWIYTHTIIRFGSVDKNFVADTFVPDSIVDTDLPIHPTDDPRRDL